MRKNNVKQLIFVTESDIDYGYLQNTIKSFYDISDTRIDKIYAGSKTKLLESRIETLIEEKKNHFDDDNKGISKVVFCYDIDDISKLKEHEENNKKIEEHCKEKGYDTIWFCRTVEEVYLGKIVSDNEKRKEMMKYIRTHDNDLAIMNKPTTKHKYNSNQIVVLDLYLNKK